MNDANVLLVMLGLAAVFAVGVTLLKISYRACLQRSLKTYRLSFPRRLEAKDVESFLDGLSGLLLPWWRRWLTSPFVILETHADRDGIEHFLLVPEAWEQTVKGLLQANLPGVRFTPTELPDARPRLGAEYRLTSNQRGLGGEAGATSARLLASLHPVGKREAVVVQWVVTPHAPVAPARIATKGEENPLFAPDGMTETGEEAAALRAKRSKPLLLAVGRIAVVATTVGRARGLLRHTEVAWHSARAPGVHLERRWLSEAGVARRVKNRQSPLVEWPGAYNTEELARLLGWPIGSVAVPGLALGGCRPLAPSPVIPTVGTVIGDSNLPGTERPLALDLPGRLRHLHVLGPTGYGKSTLLVNMITQDLEAGYGCVVLDPKGDLIADLLARIPAHRRSDVCVLNPADTEWPVGLNPLQAAAGTSSEVVVENLVGLFKSLYRSSWGPRTDDVLRAALMALAATGEATLCEVPLLLTDANYRRRVVGRLDDPVGLESFFGWFEALSDSERLTVVGPALNKLRAFTMRPRIRTIVGQTTPPLQMAEVLASGGVLLVSLAAGLLGEEAAGLMGALVVSQLWNATTARAAQPANQRRPVMAYLDEWQHFLHLPIPMSSVLAEARGLGLGLTLAHQHVSQIPDEVRGAVLADTRSRVVFQLPAADARLMEREMGGVLTDDDLMGLGQYEIAAQLFAGGSTQIPATATTRPMGPTCSDPAEILELSRRRYGVDRDEVEAAIRRRQHGQVATSVGRTRRVNGEGGTS